jgi:hypothetical protein
MLRLPTKPSADALDERRPMSFRRPSRLSRQNATKEGPCSLAYRSTALPCPSRLGATTAAWFSDLGARQIVAVSLDGLDRIDLGRPCLATMLGGPDRRTLLMLTADWRGTEGVEDVIAARTGQVLVVDAPAPGIGWS